MTLLTGGSLIQSSFNFEGAHNLEAVLIRPEPGPGQPEWRFCSKCSGLFFNGFPTQGRCPAGEGHVAAGFNFMLRHDAPGPGQPDWRFCSKCFGMFFAGGPSHGWCPADLEHEPAGFNFVLPHDVPGPGQPEWRFCDRCRGMFYNGFPAHGVCPLGGEHHASGFNFVLPHDIAWFALQHYWKPTTRPEEWKIGSTIAHEILGPGAICQRPDHDDVHGNFAVVAQVEGGLAHYFLDNSIEGPRNWIRVAGLAAPGATGPGAVVVNRTNGNLELVALHGADLVHHWFDMQAWRRGPTITDRASGAAALIQSDFNDHLEVVVPEGGDLNLYWFDGQSWQPGGLVTNAGDGPIGFVQGHYGAEPHRNFELVVPRGDTLAVYWRDNAREMRPWRPGGLATWGAGQVRAAALCSSDQGDGWLQVLTQEDSSIYSLYRHRVGEDFRWMRGNCIRLDDRAPTDVDRDHPRSVKIAQVTGESDSQHGGQTLSTSRTRSGIHGTDLGVRVEHRGRHFLLFGDTHWDDGGRVTLDSIGEIHGAADERPSVRLHGSPLRIVGGGDSTDREFDVPLDAFSLAGQFFVFYSSNHFTDGKVMGRSVLTRATAPSIPIDPGARDRTLDYQFLTTFSSYRFINVSTQLMPASAVPGFGGEGHVLLLWGSGAYRADDLRLAVLDLRDPAVWSHLLDDRPFPVSVLGPRYYVGQCQGIPSWSSHEEDAKPLFWPSALGELSVKWVPELGRYVLMAMSGTDDPIGAAVWLRTAPNPWGPWSRRRQVFDWVLDGMGQRNRDSQFIRDLSGDPDRARDCIFPEQCAGGGAAYAPYLFDVAVAGRVATFRYTLSTWNPYQVVLMQHQASFTALEELERG